MILLKKEIPVHYRNNYTETLSLNIPVECPHCGRTMSPVIYPGKSDSSNNDTNKSVGILCQCSFEDCKKYYALEYRTIDGFYNLVEYGYRPPIDIKLPSNIEYISASFKEIYIQATQAEYEKLHHVAGIGYRKSLEFLVKDYAIYKNNNDKEKIKKLPLGKVINDYLDEFAKIQRLAKASSWIGNDETHYTKIHEDKDISDFKSINFSLCSVYCSRL